MNRSIWILPGITGFSIQMVSAPWQGKKTTFLHVHHAFLYISLPSLHDYQVKMLDFTFSEGRKHAGNHKIFFLFMNLNMADRNSAPEDFACIWQSKQGGIMHNRDWKNVNSLFIRRFRGCQLSCKLSNINEGVIDASVNACCKLKLVFLEKRL